MTTGTAIKTAREELLRAVIQQPLTEEEALLWMVLLHTHAIQLRPGTLAHAGSDGNGPGAIVLPAETQRGAARVIAALWPARDNERANYVYWYWQFNKKMPYEVVADVPPELMPRLDALRSALERDSRVVRVFEED